MILLEFYGFSGSAKNKVITELIPFFLRLIRDENEKTVGFQFHETDDLFVPGDKGEYQKVVKITTDEPGDSVLSFLMQLDLLKLECLRNCKIVRVKCVSVVELGEGEYLS